jgi:hypothetical protein
MTALGTGPASPEFAVARWPKAKKVTAQFAFTKHTASDVHTRLLYYNV